MLTVALLFTASLYSIAAARIRTRAQRGRLFTIPRILAMLGGMITLAIALVSPLDELAERLLSAHMVQHLLLMLVAAPLIVWARPMPTILWALPGAARKMTGRVWKSLWRPWLARVIQHPWTAWVSFCGTLLFWHLPALYRWAHETEPRHMLMHLTFLGSALLFWSIVLEPTGPRRLDRGRTILFVLSTALVTGLPGAVLSFARHPIYSDNLPGATPFGLTALEDQQLAGLIMWIPMDLMLFGVAAALFCSWLASAGQGRREARVG